MQYRYILIDIFDLFVKLQFCWNCWKRCNIFVHNPELDSFKITLQYLTYMYIIDLFMIISFLESDMGDKAFVKISSDHDKYLQRKLQQKKCGYTDGQTPWLPYTSSHKIWRYIDLIISLANFCLSLVICMEYICNILFSCTNN